MTALHASTCHRDDVDTFHCKNETRHLDTIMKPNSGLIGYVNLSCRCIKLKDSKTRTSTCKSY